MFTRKSRILSVAVAALATAGAVGFSAAPAMAATPDNKTPVCHTTGSDKNPVVLLNVGAKGKAATAPNNVVNEVWSLDARPTDSAECALIKKVDVPTDTVADPFGVLSDLIIWVL